MKTDELVMLLSTNVEAVERQRFVRRFYGMIGCSAIAAIGLSVVALGVRDNLPTPNAVAYLSIKLGLTGVFVVSALTLLARLARPGGEHQARLAFLVIPFAAVVLLALGFLYASPTSHWRDMTSGQNWLECLISIPVIAVAPFATITWAVRQFGAPTDLVRTGAVVGLIAGGFSALGYSLHCSDDAVPFVVIWYGGTIAICTIAGAILGPKLLRW